MVESNNIKLTLFKPLFIIKLSAIDSFLCHDFIKSMLKSLTAKALLNFIHFVRAAQTCRKRFCSSISKNTLHITIQRELFQTFRLLTKSCSNQVIRTYIREGTYSLNELSSGGEVR